MRKSVLLVSTAIGLTLICNPLAARPHKSPSVDFAKAPFKSRATKRLPRPGDGPRPWRTFLTWGTTTTTLPGGFAAEDAPFHVECKKSCTVVTLNTAEFLSYYTDDNQVGICPVVDGYFTNGACYFSGTLSFQDLYANRTNQTNYTVASGTHGMQTYLYTVWPAYLGHYQNEYRVYR
jgi:hypothetical protein